MKNRVFQAATAAALSFSMLAGSFAAAPMTVLAESSEASTEAESEHDEAGLPIEKRDEEAYKAQKESESEAASEEASEEKEITYGPKLGCTLWTVREDYWGVYNKSLDEGKTEKEAATDAMTYILTSIADMGYKGYQPNNVNTNWYLMDADELKALDEKLGLTLISPHMYTVWSWPEEEQDAFLDYLVAAGANGITYDVSFPHADKYGNILNQESLQTWITETKEKLHYMQDKIEEKGYSDILRVGYHSHSLEWATLDSDGGQYMMDILYNEFGDSIDFHFDTSHTSYALGGAKTMYPYESMGPDGLITYLWKHGYQYTHYIHCKDVDMEGDHCAPAGQGDLEWNDLMKAFVYYKLEWMLVEDNHHAAFNRTGLESLQCSINYFNEMFISLGLTHPEA